MINDRRQLAEVYQQTIDIVLEGHYTSENGEEVKLPDNTKMLKGSTEDYGLEKSKFQYPKPVRFGGIYVPDATVFRAGAKDDFALLDTPYYMSFVAVAAINHPDLDRDGNICEEDAALTKNKMRTMLRIGLLNGHDSIVLGAFGCGAFRNPPTSSSNQCPASRTHLAGRQGSNCAHCPNHEPCAHDLQSASNAHRCMQQNGQHTLKFLTRHNLHQQLMTRH